MPSTNDLLTDFELYLAMGFSIPNARRAVANRVTGAKQLERLKEALDRLIAEKEEGDGEEV
ncbi:unnamed protein product [marine sediment metagenome]|uniref:Uncharacterized protein n=1 Tax=marine sediment metagenome TaxID=412755 RepID=X0XX80_9ZZZZ